MVDLNTLLVWAQHYWTMNEDWIKVVSVFVIPQALAGVLLLYLGVKLLRSSALRGRLRDKGAWMTRKERSEYEKELLAEIICDILEDVSYEGLLTRPEVEHWYRRFGMMLGLRNLLPRKEAKIKERQEVGVKKKRSYRAAAERFLAFRRRKKESEHPLDLMFS
jgi:hypothetical protein